MIPFLTSLLDKKWPVLLLVFMAFAWAIIVSEILFPFYTNIDDEAVYILQAQTLLQGRLTLPVNPFFDDFFAPVSVVNQGDRAVFKYTPVHASFLALSQLLFGSMRAVLGFVAAGNVLLLYQLCRELYGYKRLALVAAVMFLFSPFFLIQSTTFLSYPTALLLYLVFAVLLLRGQSRQSPLALIGAGVMLGLAFFARPYDTILFALPFILLFVGLNVSNIQGFKNPWQLLKQGGRILVGFLPMLSLVLIYNYHFTGHPFRFPFLLWDPSDTLGFGARWQGRVLYDLPAALEALQSNLFQVNLWIFGGTVMLGLIVWRMVTIPIRWSDFTLLLLVVIFPAGYFFFWGSYLVAIIGRFIEHLGPYYYLPVLIPLVIFGAQGLIALYQRRPALAQLLAATVIVINGSLLAWHVVQNHAYTSENQIIYRPFVEQKLKNALVLVPPIGSYLLDPFIYLGNTPTLDGPVLYALNKDYKNFPLLDAYPERTAYRFEYPEADLGTSDDNLETALVKLKRLQVDRFSQRLQIVNPTHSPYVYVDVWSGRQAESYLLDKSSRQGSVYQVEWTISPNKVEFEGTYQEHVSSIATLSPEQKLVISVAFSDDLERSTRLIFERRFTFRLTEKNQLDILTPAEEWHNPFWPVAEWQREDIDAVMTER
jgi:4-amino-4-deoxy-L-arabinose transferase-like glycosyltransferase